jgi:hypothetical protein
MVDDNGSNDAAVEATASRNKRGSNYTALEDVMICKAFIGASEDAIIGASQKGKAFQVKMHAFYLTVIDKQAAFDRTMMAQVSAGTRQSLAEEGVGPGHYLPRTPSSVYDRFKTKISPEVSKFLGVIDTTPMDSGTSKEDHINDCLAVYKARYGREFDYMKCYEYLQDKAKYTSYLSKLKSDEENNNNSALERPKGNKATKKAVEDATIIKRALDAMKDDAISTSGTSSKSGEAANQFYRDASSFLAAAGSALETYMSQSNDIQTAQMLSTPERKEFMSEAAKLRIAEMRAKRRRLQGDYSIPASVGDNGHDSVSPIQAPNGENA